MKSTFRKNGKKMRGADAVVVPSWSSLEIDNNRSDMDMPLVLQRRRWNGIITRSQRRQYLQEWINNAFSDQTNCHLRKVIALTSRRCPRGILTEEKCCRTSPMVRLSSFIHLAYCSWNMGGYASPNQRGKSANLSLSLSLSVCVCVCVK